MSAHNNAKKGDIAQSVLLPGDPLRAKFIAETYLEDAVCYNEVRNMLGYTGFYKGKRISVQGTGMGVPSISIYVQELMNDYGCKNLIRIGTAGAIHHDIKVRDVVMATAACTDSAVNRVRFNGQDYAAAASFDFALEAKRAAIVKDIPLHTGLVFSADTFYTDDPNWHKRWAEYGVLAVEMEAAALFTLAAKYRCHALALLTISDHILTGEVTTPEERQSTFTNMMEIALDACVAMEDKK